MKALARPLAALLAPALALAVGCAAAANARTEVLRWQHPNPTAVAGFRVASAVFAERAGR